MEPQDVVDILGVYIQPSNFLNFKTSWINKRVYPSEFPTCMIHYRHDTFFTARSNRLSLFSSKNFEILSETKDVVNGVNSRIMDFTSGPSEILYGCMKAAPKPVINYYTFHDNRILAKYCGPEQSSLTCLATKQAHMQDCFVAGFSNGLAVLYDLRSKVAQQQYGLFDFKDPLVSLKFNNVLYRDQTEDTTRENVLMALCEKSIHVFDVRKLKAVDIIPLEQPTMSRSFIENDSKQFDKFRPKQGDKTEIYFVDNDKIVFHSMYKSYLTFVDLYTENVGHLNFGDKRSILSLSKFTDLVGAVDGHPWDEYMAFVTKDIPNDLEIEPLGLSSLEIQLNGSGTSADPEVSRIEKELKLEEKKPIGSDKKRKRDTADAPRNDGEIIWKGHTEPILSCTFDNKTDLVVTSSKQSDRFWVSPKDEDVED